MGTREVLAQQCDVTEMQGGCMNDNVVFRFKERNLANAAASSGLGWSDASQFSNFGERSRPDEANRILGHHPSLPRVIRSIDGVAVIITTLFTAEMEHGVLTHGQAVANSVADLVAVLVFFLTSRKPRLQSAQFFRIILEQVRFLVPSLILAGIVQAGVFWWLGAGESIPFRASGIWMATAAGGVVTARSITILVLRHPSIEHRLTRKIAIIGCGAHAFRIAERLRTEARKSIRVVGIFDDGPRLSDQASVDGSIANLISLSRETNLHGIIIALPPGVESDNQVLRLSLRLRSVLADVFVMPYLVSGPDIVLPMQSIGSASFMVLQRRPLDWLQMVHKRIVDVTLSLFAVVLFCAPLFVIVAALIKIDSRGPVLFRQPRNGFNNRQFMVFKFRTMYTDATDLFSAKQTSRGDPRVTRVGRWLRRLSIDELPQLLNVLRGEMSLVGPRPHALHTRVEGLLLNDALGEYLIRYQVKPGITGWAQINGARGELVTRDDLRRRVTYDLEYIQYWSIRFDLKIMVLTAMREIFSKHAF
jgi:polysaccharide biosynthesis protein PslA